MAREAMKLVANNKKAYHDYFLMKRAISSTVSPCANAACSCTRERSSSWPARSRPRAIP